MRLSDVIGECNTISGSVSWGGWSVNVPEANKKQDSAANVGLNS